MHSDMTIDGAYRLFSLQFCTKHGTVNSITTAARTTAVPTTAPMIALVFVGWKGVPLAAFTVNDTEGKSELKCIIPSIVDIVCKSKDEKTAVYSPVSQKDPPNAEGQLHKYSKMCCLQVPPF